MSEQPRGAEQKACYCGAPVARQRSRGCSRLPSTHCVFRVPWQTGPALPGVPALVDFLVNGWIGPGLLKEDPVGL